MNNTTQPTVGLKFLHSRFITATREPMPHVVTRIARGTVYYRAVDIDGSLGSPYCCNVEDFGKYVKPTPTSTANYGATGTATLAECAADAE